jgi:hypothetical protein
MPAWGEIFHIKVKDQWCDVFWIGEGKKNNGERLWMFQSGQEVFVIPANNFAAARGRPQAPLVASLK